MKHSPAGAPARAAAPNQPDDPEPEQVNAGVEFAELISDQDFRQRIRRWTGYRMQIQAGDRLLDWDQTADRAVPAAHGHDQRMAAVPFPHARRRPRLVLVSRLPSPC
jgi:hypothetical protein